MKVKLRIGLIGCGRHGLTLARATQETGLASITACADVDRSAATAMAALAGAASAHATAGEMLTKAEIDAVIVGTPHHLLREICLEAIAAGKHVFVEKPMGINARQGREIVQAARRAGVRLMVGYCLRFTEVRTKMRDLLAQGAAGDVQAISAGKGGEPLEGWLARPDSGGGQLMFLGSHLVDQIIWLLGDRPAEVFADVRYRSDTGSDETSAFQIKFAGGAVAQCIVSQAIGAYYDFVEFMGRSGRVRSDWPLNTIDVTSRALAAYSSPTRIGIVSDPRMPMYVAELREFAQAVREGRDPSVTGEQATEVLEVLDAVVASGKAGKAVRL